MSHYFLIFLGSSHTSKDLGDKKSNVFKSLREVLKGNKANVVGDGNKLGSIIDGPGIHFVSRSKAVPELNISGGKAKDKLKANLPEGRTDIVCIGHSRGAVLAGAFAKWLKGDPRQGKVEDQALKGKVGKVSVLSIDPVPEIGTGFLGGPSSASKKWAMGVNLERYWYVYMSDPTITFQRLRLAQRDEGNNVDFRWIVVPGVHGSVMKDPSVDPSAKILLSIAHQFVNKCGVGIGGGPNQTEVCKAYFDAAMKYKKLKTTNSSDYAVFIDKLDRKAPNFQDREARIKLSKAVGRNGLFINSHLSNLIDQQGYRTIMELLYDELKKGNKIGKEETHRSVLTTKYGKNAFKYIEVCAKR